MRGHSTLVALLGMLVVGGVVAGPLLAAEPEGRAAEGTGFGPLILYRGPHPANPEAAYQVAAVDRVGNPYPRWVLGRVAPSITRLPDPPVH